MNDAWLFRVDSRAEVGAGHLSRCFALGQELRAANPVHFVLDEGCDQWRDRLRRVGITSELATDSTWVDEGWFGCVVDGYEFSDIEIADWRAKTGFVVAFSDTGEPSSHADLVMSSRLAEGRSASGPMILSGLEYALLDAAYRTEEVSGTSQGVAHIVICFGARDGSNATELSLHALKLALSDSDEVHTTVVLGSNAPHLSAITSIVEENDPRISLSVDEANMPKLLRSADLAIGAGGVCMLERMACGVPSITIATAENQLEIIKQAAESGGMNYAGRVAQISTLNLADAASELLSNHNRRTEMGIRARETVYGWGAFRAAEAINKCRMKTSPLQQ